MHNSDFDDADSLFEPISTWQWFDWVETSNQLLFLRKHQSRMIPKNGAYEIW